MSSPQRIIVVGNPGPEHVGAHFLSAARSLGLEATLVDHRRAWGSNRIVNAIAFRVNRRPTRLASFDRELAGMVSRLRPALVVVTGISAPDASALRGLRESGARVVSYLTDDPWNPRNSAPFFRDALREYDAVYSPRRSNLSDLERHGCRRVAYLPFAYNPEVHFVERAVTDEERLRFECDVAIVGGADEDRVPIAIALARTGLRLRLFGGYWDRWPETRPYHCGFAVGRDLRMAVSGATVNVCMVRRANRDGHSMRSLEVPAMGGCIVAEETAEHRELYGGSDGPVTYFATIDELVARTADLCGDPAAARLSAERLCIHIRERSRHTYADRLRWIIRDVGT